MKKIIILIAMLCTFASANCQIGKSTEFVNVFCINGTENFSVTMRKDGNHIKYIEEFNNKTTETIIFVEPGTERIYCIRHEKDKYGVVIDKKSWFGCETPSEKWNEFKAIYNF